MKHPLIRVALGALAVAGLVAATLSPAHAIDTRSLPITDHLYSLSCTEDFAHGQLFSVEASTGNSTRIGSGTDGHTSCAGQPAWDAATKTVYSFLFDISGFQKVDLATGVFTPVVAFTSTNPVDISAIAIGPTGLAYATGGGTLYSLDLASGVVVPIGAMGTDHIYGLAFNLSTGILYGINVGGGLFTLSTSTGVASPLATLDLSPRNNENSLQVASDGILWIQNNNDNLGSDLWSVDPAATDIAASARLSSSLTYGDSVSYYTEAYLIVPIHTAPTITSANTFTATVGTAFSFTAVASGTPTPTFTLTGTLPTGVTFNTATGVLSGTATTAGAFPFTITSTNDSGHNNQTFTLTVIHLPNVSG